MPTTETPTLHLGYGDDERINRNWQILDNFIRSLGSRSIIPEDLLVQGNLEVLGDAAVRGDLTVDGTFVPNTVSAAHVTTPDLLIPFGGHLTVQDGTIVTLPNASIAGAALKRGAALWTYNTGTAGSTLPIVDFEVRELCRVTLTNEGSFNPTLVIATATLQFQIGNIAGTRTVTAQLRLLANGVIQQQRDFSYTYVTANNLSIDYPITMVRFAQPGDSGGVWSLEGTVTAGIPGGGGIAVVSKFSQLIAIQPR
jgi:hypothetical protein